MMVKHMVLADYTIFTVVSQYHIYIAYLIMHVWYQPVTPFLLQSASTTTM
jgi:hypothetical protein